MDTQDKRGTAFRHHPLPHALANAGRGFPHTEIPPHLVAPLLGRKLDITHSFYTPSPNVNTAKTHLPAHMQHLAQKHHLSAF